MSLATELYDARIQLGKSAKYGEASVEYQTTLTRIAEIEATMTPQDRLSFGLLISQYLWEKCGGVISVEQAADILTTTQSRAKRT